MLLRMMIGALGPSTPPARPTAGATVAKPWVNLDNLDTLEFSFPGQDGTPKTGWSIYAEPVDRSQPLGAVKQVGAPGEGFSCVDDVARVALVDLQQFEKTGKPELGAKATEAIKFCLNQQDGQGHFYNFVNADGSINKTGQTSVPGLNWWTARAFWALERADRVLGPTADPALKGQIESAIDKTLTKLEQSRDQAVVPPQLAQTYKDMGVKPGSLVDDSGSITSIFALGLLERVKAHPEDTRSKDLLTTYCDAMTHTAKPSDDPMLGDMHINSMWDPTTVHLYGNRQVKALADAGSLLGRQDWVDSARREVDHAYPRMLASYLVPFAFSPSPEPNPQIAYAAEAVVTNLQAVYRATGETKFSLLAGMYGTWFNGANVAGLPVYHPETGRSFDGVDPSGVSTNSGAESNVETQMAMSDLQNTPGESLLGFDHTTPGQGETLLAEGDLKVGAGNPGHLNRTLNGGAVRSEWMLSQGDALEVAPKGTGYVTWKSDAQQPLLVDGKPVTPKGDSWQVTPIQGTTELGGQVEVDSVVDRAAHMSREWSDGAQKLTLDVDPGSATWNISRH
jgi:hypothetical protein